MLAKESKEPLSASQTRAAARIAALAVILLAAGLRLHLLGAQSLWNDEGASVVMAHRTATEIVANAAADIHPPGYYLLLAGWVKLVGETEFALRALSALESVLTVALTYALGRRLFGAGAGLVAALLLALNTFAIYYAQEARMYAQLGLLAAAGMGALVWWMTSRSASKQIAGHRPPGVQNPRLSPSESPLKGLLARTSSPFSGLPKWLARGLEPLATAWQATLAHQQARHLLALTLINAAGLYTHYAYPFTLIVQGVIFLGWWQRRRNGRTLGLYLAANAGTLLLFAPWAGEAIRQVTTWPNTGGATDPATLIRTLAYGITGVHGELPLLAAGGALILAAGLGSGLKPIVASPHPNYLRLTLPVLWALIPAGAFLALGLQPDDLKSLLPATTAVALWLGIGAAALWRQGCFSYRAVAVIGLIGLLPTLIGGLPTLYHDPAYARDDYRAMAAVVSAAPRPGEAVILDGPGQGEVWAYYNRSDAPVYPLPRGLGGDDEATRAELEQILRDHRRLFVLFWGEGERDPNRVVETTLDAQAFEVETRWYGDVRFVIYATPGEAAITPTERLNIRFGERITLTGFALSETAFHPGDALTLTLFWATDAPLGVRYKVFVHLYTDPTAPPLAQHDSEPGGGLAPTTEWTPGETITDRHGVLIPASLEPGDYTLAIGLYDMADPQARLLTAQGERLPLATVHVEE